MESLTISIDTIIDLSDDKLFELCQQHSELRFERNAQGDLAIMAPEGSDTGRVSFELSGQLWNWNERKKLGVAFGTSAGFILPNGAMRSPDVSWILKERWEALSPAQQAKFAPICPDFVIELMSPNDNLIITQTKMKEYQDNGTRLGWLINRKDRQVEIYRFGQSVEILENPNSLSGENVLPEFSLSLETIW
ncbi:hypothetical protein Syn7502_00927 [Synechococcus sp. PCC 7502]|uniref:Uma2 family endonuclease n=1 Tax=Synechococcus sp. PCC 7502 TaxID=1173263 RepID=UPI00029FCF65|nr:Uma2 family endonuclease [Synechococcus sp. PCC 7502]AFY73045.1 hypothetical protein Syn7502_00927 [Synechococcus sp. PCC 7502]